MQFLPFYLNLLSNTPIFLVLFCHPHYVGYMFDTHNGHNFGGAPRHVLKVRKNKLEIYFAPKSEPYWSTLVASPSV